MNINSLHRIKLLFIILAATILSSTIRAAETGSSHNLFYLNKLNDNSFFVGRANLVTRDGFSDTFFGYVDANYRYLLTGPWSVEVGYRHAFLELGNQWREEYRPMLSLYWRGKLAEGKFSNRHRIEWRYFEGNAKDRVRYRNESVWTSLHTITDYQLTPFIAEEFFYDITDSELNINWLTFGISKFWSKGMKWKLGYRLQSQKFNGEWENRHMLVTGISIFSFD
jgi:hypothetical protein